MSIIQLRDIPHNYEAVKFTGDNHQELQKFAARHGAPIEWQKTEDGDVTHALIQTVTGTERIGKGAYLLANSVDQLSRAHRDEVESDEHRRYVEVSELSLLTEEDMQNAIVHPVQLTESELKEWFKFDDSAYSASLTVIALLQERGLPVEIVNGVPLNVCTMCKEEREPDEVADVFGKLVCKYCVS